MDASHADDERQGALKLRERRETALAIEQAEPGREAGRVGVQRRIGDPDPLERERQHAHRRKGAQRVLDGARVRVGGRTEYALPESVLIQALRPHLEVATENHVGEPRRVGRAGRLILGSADVERAHPHRPPAERRPPVLVGPCSRKERRQIAQRPRERKGLHAPVAVRLGRLGDERFEALDPDAAIVHPQSERKGLRGRLQVGHRIVDVGDAGVALLEELAHEPLGLIDARADRRLPQGHGVRAAWRHDAAGGDAQAAGERGKGRRAPFMHARERGRMIREERQRLVVQRGEAVADERRVAVAQNRHQHRAVGQRPMNDRFAPQSRCQRNRNQLDRAGGRRCRRTKRFDASEARVRHRVPSLRDVVDEPRDFGSEPGGVWCGIDAERRCQSRDPAGHGDIFGNRPLSGEARPECRYNRETADDRRARQVSQKAHIIYMVASGLARAVRRFSRRRGWAVRLAVRNPRLGGRSCDCRSRFKRLSHSPSGWIVVSLEIPLSK